MQKRTALAAALTAAVLVPAPALAQTSDTSTGTVPPTPVPAATPTPVLDCAPLVVGQDVRDTVLPTAPAWGLDGQGGRTIRVMALDPGSTVGAYAYERPRSTEYQQAATATVGMDGTATFTFPWQGSARVYFVGGGCSFSSPRYLAPAQDRFGGLVARRKGPRAYTFSFFFHGGAGKVFSLYRVTPDGRSVLTAQKRSGPEWVVIDRTFTGSGRFGFYVSTGTDATSVGSRTDVRDTVIH